MTEPIGLALIGLGNWSKHLATAAQRSPDVNLASCWTRTPEKRATFAAEHSCLDAPTLEAALDAPGVQAVVIAAPADAHQALTEACAAHGIHVLVEKPMALSIEEGLAMQRACDAAGVVLMVGHEMRRLGSTRAVHHLVESGALGRVITAVGSLTLKGRFDPPNWRTSRVTNRGGALIQLGIHMIENFNYLFGQPVSVQGTFANAVAPNDVDDVGVAVIGYENGTQAVVSSNYVSPSANDYRLYGERANVVCQADMRVWPDAQRVDPGTHLTLHTPEGVEDVPRDTVDVLAEQYADFAHSIRSGEPPETGAPEGLLTLAVVEAALRSAEAGGTVDPRTFLPGA